eukprot:jgi/Orpsp1_1/1183451/evm.model.c7180000085262.1
MSRYNSESIEKSYNIESGEEYTQNLQNQAPLNVPEDTNKNEEKYYFNSNKYIILQDNKGACIYLLTIIASFTLGIFALVYIIKYGMPVGDNSVYLNIFNYYNN